MSNKSKLRFIDLFAGIGGTRIACEQAAKKLKIETECVFTSEIDKHCRDTYQNYFGNSEINHNINLYEKDNDIKENIPCHDLLLAGFPCQAFSHAGLKKGFDDARGTLFFSILKILQNKKPKMFLLENVAHLKGHDSGKTLKTMLKYLRDDLNYYVPDPQILNAKDFGLPQNRRRIFIVGFKNKKSNFKFPIGTQKNTSVGDILEKNLVTKKYKISPKLWRSHKARKKRNEKRGWGFGYSLVKRSDNHTRTLSARYYKDGSEILVSRGSDKEPRKLTPRECASLQGFPKKFEPNNSRIQAYKQFGNSVPIPVIKFLCIEMFKVTNF